MKHASNKLIIPMLILIISSSIGCKKIKCEYKQQCIESEPNGYMVGTMASDVNSINKNSVAVLYKTLHNSQAPVGNNWNDPTAGSNQVARVFPANWTSDKIGEVFGIALDHNSGIYLAATDVYKFDFSLPNLLGQVVNWSSGAGPAGSAGIYYTNYGSINTTIPLVTTLNSSNTNTWNLSQIPSTGFATSVGNSLGNIAFDYTNNQLFATNLEDGRIYRIDPITGKVKSILDPFVLDNGIAGIAPIGEQLWGVGVHTLGGVTKVYFARTTLPHNGGGSVYGGVEIWSVALSATGEFAAANGGSGLYTASTGSGFVSKELDVSTGFQTKVTDIAFSSTGKMLLAERGHPHRSKIFEYTFNGTAWITGNNYYLGFDLSVLGSNYLYGRNSSGGVDYADREAVSAVTGNSYLCNDIVWASMNAGATKLLPIGGGYPNYIYGAQGMSSAGNNAVLSVNATNDLYIDYNCTGWKHYGWNNPPIATVKGKIGDIEFFDQTCSCK